MYSHVFSLGSSGKIVTVHLGEKKQESKERPGERKGAILLSLNVFKNSLKKFCEVEVTIARGKNVQPWKQENFHQTFEFKFKN